MLSEAERLSVRVARLERLVFALIAEWNRTHTHPLYSGEWSADQDLDDLKRDHERWSDTGQV